MRHYKQMVLTGLLVSGFLVEASAQVSWTLRNPLPRMKVLQSVLWTGDMSVVVGDSGTIATSANGASWAFRVSGTTNTLTAIASGNGVMVAVGSGGIITSSTDGVTWTPRTSPVATNLNAVTWAGTRFVAVGAGGVVISSPNGVTWTQHSSGVSSILRSIAWTGSAAVIVGDGGTVVTSPDGVTWTARTSGTTTALYGVHFGGGQVVAVGNAGAVRTSPDGISWTARTSGVTTYLNSVTWTGSLYAAVGDAGTIITSPDGITWSIRTSGTAEVLRSVTWTATRLMAVGNAGVIRTSSNGTTWSSPAVTTAGLNSAAWAQDKPRVIAADGGAVLTSTGDTGWVLRATGITNGLYAVTWAGNQVVAVGATGAIVTSPDAMSWTSRTSGTTEVLNSVAWSGSVLATVGGNGTIRTSVDGISWTARTSGVTSFIYAVAWCGNQFVAVGAGGLIWTSANGSTWTQRASNSTAILRSVTFADNQVVVVGAGGVVLTSPDGITWTSRTSGTTATLYSVAWNGSSLVASSTGMLLTSTDGNSWSHQVVETTSALYSVTGVNGGWLAVGAGGTILTSPQVALPVAPVLTAPANSSINVSVYGPLSWESVSGASHYHLQVATDSNFVGTVFNDTVGGLSRGLSALASNTLHFWRVRAHNQLGGGAWSTMRRFTTGQAPTGPPPAPVLVGPALFATGVAIPVALTWNASNGAEFYRVQVSTSPVFAGTVLDDSTVSVTGRSFPTASGGVDYYWRVSARNGLGTGAWSETWTFRTAAAVPGIPSLVSPEAFQTNVSRLPTVTWGAVSGASSYHAQIASDAGFTTVVTRDSTLASTSFTSSIVLPASTAHYWRVRAKNSAGVGEWSAIRRFTTGTDDVSVFPGARLAHFSRAAGHGLLRFHLARPERVVVNLYTLQGRHVARVLDETRAVGIHTVALPEGLGESLLLLEFRAGVRREWMTIHR